MKEEGDAAPGGVVDHHVGVLENVFLHLKY